MENWDPKWDGPAPFPGRGADSHPVLMPGTQSLPPTAATSGPMGSPSQGCLDLSAPSHQPKPGKPHSAAVQPLGYCLLPLVTVTCSEREPLLCLKLLGDSQWCPTGERGPHPASSRSPQPPPSRPDACARPQFPGARLPAGHAAGRAIILRCPERRPCGRGLPATALSCLRSLAPPPPPATCRYQKLLLANYKTTTQCDSGRLEFAGL